MAGFFPAAVAFHLCLLLCSSSSLRVAPGSSSSPARHGSRRVRTAYHFQPAKNWQNDPNGPMYHNGLYHFFYQYNPGGATWGTGNLSWGHSVSRDLVNWVALDDALVPGSPFDANGCWSGSATLLPGGTGPAFLYTGIDAAGEQVQNVAFPKDPSDLLLREWVKPGYNPIIPLPTGVPRDSFRDPSTAWQGRDGLWRVAVSAAMADGGGSTLVYRSGDFRRWERNPAPLHLSGPAGMVECPDLFPVAAPGKEEGLEFDYSSSPSSASSPAAARHVLKLSVMDTLQDYYAVGRYDDTTDTFTPVDEGGEDDCRSWRRFDYGHVYASKSFFDARKSRRVLWAWANESDSQADDIARGWSGIQIFPRKVWLDADGKQLRQWPVEEIETLRIPNNKRASRLSLPPGADQVNAGGVNEIVGVAGSQADVEAVFEVPALDNAESLDDDNPSWLLDPQRLCGEKGASVRGGVGPFGLLVLASGDLQQHTAVFFRVFRYQGKYKTLMCTDLTRSSTRAGVYKPAYGAFVDMDVQEHGAVISLRTLVDHSVVESFGAGGRTCMTARVYPDETTGANGEEGSRMYVFNNGTGAVKVARLEAWELATASVNVDAAAGSILLGSSEAQ